jgi:replicative DNA helicase
VNDHLDPERALVGIVLDRPQLLRDVEDVDPADFRDPRLEALWGLMLWLDQNRMPPQPALVASHLSRIDIPIDPTLITDLYGEAPAGGLARLYADRVINSATLRRLHNAMSSAIALTEDPTGNAQEIQEEIRAKVDKASRAIAEIQTVSETIDETIDELEAPNVSSIPTPWEDLNYLIRGWRPGALYVIGARPAVGKSIMGLQAAEGLSRHGWVALHSLEMPRAELNKRLLASLGDVPLVRMDDKTLTDRDWQHIAKARADIATRQLSIDDRSSIRVLDIRSYARTLARRGPLAGIVVDYLQLMSAAHGDRRQRWEIVGDWSRQLKVLAKELAIPVIVLSQLNREVAGRADKRPTMTDLRESGGIEQDADVILLLHVDEDTDPSAMEVGIAKNRHGRTGRINLERRGDIARLDPARWTPGKAAR